MKKQTLIKGYRYQQLLFKYQKLQQRLKQSIARGNFYNWSKRRRQQLIVRLQRYAQRLNQKMFGIKQLSNSLLLTSALISQTPSTLSGQVFSVKDFAPQAFGIGDRGSRSSPTFVDIDGDGDLDAFIGGEDGNTNFLRNIGSRSNPIFSAEANFGIENVGNRSRPAFVDIDDDGDLDVFIGNSAGNTSFFRNTGDKTNPVFSAEANFGIGDVGNRSAPTFIDIDGDKDFDLFIGEGQGGTIFYRNTGTKTNPIFSLDTSSTPFGIEDVGRYSTPTFVDIDDDGDFDAFIGVGGFETESGRTNFFRNTGTNTNPIFSLDANTSPFGIGDVGRYSSPSFADIDDDGDFDAFIGEGDGNTIFYRNTGTKTNAVFNCVVFGIENIGSFSNPDFVDIDDDGDFDAFIGESNGSTRFFRNTGSKTNPVFSLDVNTTPFSITNIGYNSSPSFVDIDDDGDFDAFVGEYYGSTRFFRNTGSKTNPVFSLDTNTAPFGIGDIGSYYSSPTFVDIDDDGDFDAFIGGAGGSTNFFRNTGSKTNPVFSAEGNFGIGDIGRGSVPTFVDIDRDGDFDAFIGEEDGNTAFYRNVGTDTSPSFSLDTNVALFGIGGGFSSSPSFVDIDDDNDFDVFFGELGGKVFFFENIEPIPCSNEIEVIQVLANTNKKASNTIITTGTVTVNQTVVYQAGTSITLNAGFHAMAGSDFQALIATCVQPLKETDRVAYSRNTLSGKEIASGKESLSLIAAPNPFTNEMRLQYQLPEQGAIHLQIVSITGQTLLQESIQDVETGIFARNISTRDWPSGIYFIRLSTEKEQVILKMIKGKE